MYPVGQPRFVLIACMWKISMLVFCPFLFMIAIWPSAEACFCEGNSSDSEVETKTYPFTKLAAVNLYDYMAHSNKSITWGKATNHFECALQAFNQCCTPKGFLFDSPSQICGTVLWDQERNFEIPILNSGTSSLYRYEGGSCKPEYKEYQYFSDNQIITTCLWWATDRGRTFANSRKVCQSMEGYLASTKTLEKLALLIEISEGIAFWVGLTDKETDQVFVWEEDGTVLSQEKTLELFEPGEPSHGDNQDCIALRPPDTKLHDRRCLSYKFYFCEVKPGC